MAGQGGEGAWLSRYRQAGQPRLERWHQQGIGPRRADRGHRQRHQVCRANHRGAHGGAAEGDKLLGIGRCRRASEFGMRGADQERRLPELRGQIHGRYQDGRRYAEQRQAHSGRPARGREREDTPHSGRDFPRAELPRREPRGRDD